MQIRQARAADRAACYNVCLRTSDNGGDGAHLFDDPEILGHIFVGPYLEFAPEFSWVLEDAQGVCGYVLGVRDTAAFFRWFETDWLPRIRRNYTEPTGDPAKLSRTQSFVRELFHPDTYYPPLFHPYPAHMHIDLLARAQGQGWGRRMTELLLEKLKSAGAPGVHLGTYITNVRAQTFYRKLGFQDLERLPSCLYMARPL